MATNYNAAGRAALDAKIQGLRAAKAAFQALPPLMQDALNEAVFLTTSEIVRLAKQFLLGHRSVRTRSLYNAIGFTSNRRAGEGKAGIMNVTTTMKVGNKRVRVRGIAIAGRGGSALTSEGAKLVKPRRYAHLVEFGTYRSAAKPFMQPAVDIERPLYLERCRRAGQRAEQTVATIGGRYL